VKIDFHVHLTPPEISANAERYALREPYFALLASNPNNRFAAGPEAVAELDRTGFDRAVVFGFGFQDMGLCRMVNDYVIDQTRQYPGRLTGYMVVPPAHRDAEREIDRAYRAGLRGAGELFPDGQNFRLDDPKDTRILAAACAERGIPVLLHLNEPVGHYYPGKTSATLAQTERLLDHHPGLTVILAHWGGGFLFYELMPEIRKKCRNLYYDTAASVLLYDAGIYACARSLGVEERLLFGSDFPLLSPERYLPGIAQSGIPRESRDRLLGGNGEALLRKTGAW
jgi:predicted TIM-barrel fold metal-dependent hydrolase